MIVFDASTLILLAKAELLEHFLETSRIEAIVPPEAAREACEMKQSFDALLIRRLIDEEKIVVEPVRDRPLFDRLRRDLALGVGEAQAVALAVHKKAALVATDDRHGINACKLVQIPFTSALAILVRMHSQGVLTQEVALQKLAILEKVGRYKKSIIMAVRSRLEVR